ncbi:death domain-containing protein 1, partial [Biomphalaria pfeifferi]
MSERPDHSEEEGNAAVLQSQHKTVYVPFDQKREETTFTDQKREEKENKEFADFKKQDSSSSEPKQYPQSHITPANFNVREFNTNLTEFIRTLDDPRFSQVDQEYPMKEFTSIIGMITKSVNDYRQHTHDSQLQLEHLRERMKTIKESLHFSVSRQAMDLRAEDAHQTQEELDLTAKLTQLNAILAQAHADVTEALRLAAETQSLAIKSNIAADKAREETRRLEEEIEKRENAEKKKKEEDTRRKEEDKKRKEEEEKKLQEERQKKEEEWRKMESLQNEKMSQPYDSWIPVPYVHVNESGETEVTCIARGQPGHFDEHNVSCKVAKEMEGLITYQPNEELISHVIELSSQDGHNQLKHPIYVAIPHVLSRSTAQSKEAVVKAMVEGEWKDLPTRDVTFDTHKDTKFAQAEVRHLTTLLVMSRFKRDYITLMPNKACKAVSSFDQRITLDIEKDTLVKKEHFLLQVQPVDSGTLQDFRSRQPQGKSLLSSSSIVYTQWETIQFKKPIQHYTE